MICGIAESDQRVASAVTRVSHLATRNNAALGIPNDRFPSIAVMTAIDPLPP